MLLLLLNFPLGIFAQNFVSYDLAKEAAVKWMQAKGYSKTIDESTSYNNLEAAIGEELTFYVLNFNEQGFAIVPVTKQVVPVLAYNNQGASPIDKIQKGATFLFESYNEAIQIHLNTAIDMETASTAWTNLIQNTSITCLGQSTPYPSLLEHYHTSRWAGWDGVYECITPFQNLVPDSNYPDHPHLNNAGGTCVPTSLSQICKFYKHPYIGSGTGTHTITSNTASFKINGVNTIMPISVCYGQIVSSIFSTHIFDYNQMDYQLGNQGPVDGGIWGSLTPACSKTRNEVGNLMFNLGVAVEMNWYGTGTYGNTYQWANQMVDHFGYTWNSSIDYVYSYNNNNTNTSPNPPTNPNGFKNAVRASLLNERPVFVAGNRAGSGGHAYLYTGFECNDYFYATLGFGGNDDGFYYLFLADSTGNYIGTAYNYHQNAATNLRPACNFPTNLTLNNQTYTDPNVEQAQNNITASNTTVQAGSKTFMIGGNSVELTSNVEVVLGAELFINIETCGVPKQGY